MIKEKIFKYILFGILAITVFCGGCYSNERKLVEGFKDEESRKSNVILITISSLRADHAGCFGYGRDTTDNFDEFANRNILFTGFYSTSSWMMPAHGSIFTSLYPREHGATHISKKLGEEHKTLAEILKGQGYFCAGFCCNPRLGNEMGFGQGFDLYDDFSVDAILSSQEVFNGDGFEIDKSRTNDLINRSAMGWLGKNDRRPFFLFIHYYDNHWDYLPPRPYRDFYDPGYDGQMRGEDIAREPLYSNRPGDEDVYHIIALYDEEVRQSDEDLGVMLKYLEQEGYFENSIIIIAGDHGEQFYEHGNTSHHGIYDELVHVPMAVSIAGRVKSKVIDSLVSSVDIMPTVLDLLEIEDINNRRGKSLKPLIDGEVEKVNEMVFMEYSGGAVADCIAVRSESSKYVESGEECFIYDLEKDPNEQKRIYKEDFSDEMKEQVGKFRQMIEEIDEGRQEKND